MDDGLISPHGGALVNRLTQAWEAAGFIETARSMPITRRSIPRSGPATMR